MAKLDTAIEIRKENTYIGYWHGEFSNGDFFGIAWKEPNGSWQIKYRFRYYKDHKVFDSDDIKNWYHMWTKDGSAVECERMKQIFTKILKVSVAQDFLKNMSFTECMGDGERMIQLLMDKPYLHKKIMDDEEA